MSSSLRKADSWRLRTRTLQLGRRTLIMGIVNITPDSFSDGGCFLAPEAAVARSTQMLDEGADVLDLGAESTRPGSRAGSRAKAEDFASRAPESWESVSAEEEQARLLPVIEGVLALRPNAIISVDTYKAATARAALTAGAEIINDVSGFLWDREIAAVCAEFNAGVVLMHTRGRPEEWRSQPQLASGELLTVVRAGLAARLEAAAAAGIPPQAVVLDPGYGFGKQFDENYTLLARQAELLSLGRPLLAGLSRKSFLSKTLAAIYPDSASHADETNQSRETASLAALGAAILNGASIVRVHAVRPAVEAGLIMDAVLAAGAEEA